MPTMQEQITAALQKLGPSTRAELAADLDSSGPAVGYHLKAMLGVGTIKAAGSMKERRFALPDQELAGSSAAPPQRRKKHRKSPHAKRAPRAATPRARATTKPERFLATVDAERRLVIVNGGEPLIFNDEQTAAIATLLFTHYDKE
jgi:hypothetical protein